MEEAEETLYALSEDTLTRRACPPGHMAPGEEVRKHGNQTLVRLWLGSEMSSRQGDKESSV